MSSNNSNGLVGKKVTPYETSPTDLDGEFDPLEEYK